MSRYYERMFLWYLYVATQTNTDLFKTYRITHFDINKRRYKNIDNGTLIIEHKYITERI